jgi:hypothetical protein
LEGSSIGLEYSSKREGFEHEISGFRFGSNALGDTGPGAVGGSKDRLEFGLGRGAKHGGLREGGNDQNASQLLTVL